MVQNAICSVSTSVISYLEDNKICIRNCLCQKVTLLRFIVTKIDAVTQIKALIRIHKKYGISNFKQQCKAAYFALIADVDI